MADAIEVSAPISGTDRRLTLETGKLAGQADGAVVARLGDTVVLVTATAAKTVREGIDFFPLTVDIEERREHALPLIRIASAIEPEWLLDFYPEHVREKNEITWNRTAERVESRSVLLFDEIVIEETRSGAVDAELAAEMLASKALEAGITRFVDPEEL